jgi:hypothetical protein
MYIRQIANCNNVTVSSVSATAGTVLFDENMLVKYLVCIYIFNYFFVTFVRISDFYY